MQLSLPRRAMVERVTKTRTVGVIVATGVVTGFCACLCCVLFICVCVLFVGLYLGCIVLQGGCYFCVCIGYGVNGLVIQIVIVL